MSKSTEELKKEKRDFYNAIELKARSSGRTGRTYLQVSLEASRGANVMLMVHDEKSIKIAQDKIASVLNAAFGAAIVGMRSGEIELCNGSKIYIVAMSKFYKMQDRDRVHYSVCRNITKSFQDHYCDHLLAINRYGR